MTLSFFKRALLPQLVLFALVVAVDEGIPLSDSPIPADSFVPCHKRFATFVGLAVVAWAVSMGLCGYFLPDERPPLFRIPWGLLTRPVVYSWLLVIALYGLIFVPLLAGTYLLAAFAIQFVGFLLFCIRLYGVFVKTIGPSVLEALEKAKEERKLAGGVARIDREIAAAEDDLRQLRASPLHDEDDVDSPVSDSILQLERKLRQLREERSILTGGNYP